jgi:hypothetical protein
VGEIAFSDAAHTHAEREREREEIKRERSEFVLKRIYLSWFLFSLC